MASARRLAGLFLAALATIGCRHAAADPPSAGPSDTGTFDFMVVGTAHRGHLQIPDYPLSRLDELVAAFRPDLILVEIRPEPFAEGRLEDGPFEMSYVTLRARAQGIAVEPIDWHPPSFAPPSDEDPSEAAFRADIGPLYDEYDSYAPFAVLNGPKRQRDFLTVENASARHGRPSNVEWHRRQAWMHHRALAAIERRRARRVAAFVGFGHRAELDVWLRATGGRSTSPVAVLSTSRGELRPAVGKAVDDDVVRVWREGIARLRREAASAEPPMRSRLEAKVRYWEIAVERRGLCCVDDAAFTAR